MTTFKKFFKWMISLNFISKDEYEYLMELIKEEKEDWFNSVSYEDDSFCW